MSHGAPPGKAKPIKVNVARCRSESCDALLTLEETSEGVLLGNMLDIAERDGDRTFFSCPKCGGRNLAEEVVHKGKLRAKLSGFEPAPAL